MRPVTKIITTIPAVISAMPIHSGSVDALLQSAPAISNAAPKPISTRELRQKNLRNAKPFE
ncbi:hypothetical protein GAO09_24720 [Rhizobiales bacterium RZME27]|uniref:Uncharacterized protein n=1 Tax=Endobacterium cereale TaxID=2663029 RepID=A0A6A8AD54_9HYPH|nr:hypothetical protein [Endobacterium cereale]MEB2847395.1 hypothetical protein [Endobacterium cereale]MQY49245.1 hypothetical protein [Endobacterium cereale]